MSAGGIHISISAEKVFSIGSFPVTNSIFTSLIVSTILILFALLVRSRLTSSGKQSGVQNFAEWIVESLHSLVFNVTGDLKKTRLFFPFVATFFLFILLNNWFGLLPGVGTIYVVENPKMELSQVQDEVSLSPLVGQALAVADHEDEVLEHTSNDSDHSAELAGTGEATNDAHTEDSTTVAHDEELAPKRAPLFRAGTADLNTTIALALITVITTQVIGIRFLGGAYFKKFINFSSPIMFFVGLLELVLELAKVMSFAFRLFGNVFAGEVLLVVIAFLVPVIAPMPFYGLELFVGFIQALVFSMLSLVFFNMATIGHEEH